MDNEHPYSSPSYSSTDKADVIPRNIVPEMNSGVAHVMPSASIVKGGIAAMTFLEVLALAGGAFVIWKNRERILDFLETSGVDLKEFFAGVIRKEA